MYKVQRKAGLTSTLAVHLKLRVSYLIHYLISVYQISNFESNSANFRLNQMILAYESVNYVAQNQTLY